MDTLVSLADFATRVPGGIDNADEDRAQGILEDASAVVRSEGLSSWTAATAPAIAKTVCITAALRAFANPEGVMSTQDSLDNYSHGKSFANSSPDVYLKPDERRRLRAAAGRTGLWALGTSRSAPTWVADVPDIMGVDSDIPEEVDPFGEGWPG